MFIAVVILICFVVIYCFNIAFFLLNHGSNVSVVAVESSVDSLLDVIAAVNRRDNGSISDPFVCMESGSVNGLDGVGNVGVDVV